MRLVFNASEDQTGKHGIGVVQLAPRTWCVAVDGKTVGSGFATQAEAEMIAEWLRYATPELLPALAWQGLERPASAR